MDDLSDAEALAYIALWNFVDDDGRHANSARELEMKCPRSSFRGQWQSFIDSFINKGLLVPYEVGKKRYFYIRTWHRHQAINRPTLSTIPSPPKGDPIKEEKKKRSQSSVPLNEGIPYEDIINLWNETLGTLCPTVKYDPQDTILVLIRSTWMAWEERQSLDWWKKLFMYMVKSKFLTGQKTNFVARLRWTLIPDNLAKIQDGYYHDDDKGPGRGAARRFANGKGSNP